MSFHRKRRRVICIKIVIVGEGKIGAALALQLSQENHDVTIIDNDPDVVEHAVDTLDILGIVTETEEGGFQRKGCMCLKGKTELLTEKRICPSGCLYCYWKD